MNAIFFLGDTDITQINLKNIDKTQCFLLKDILNPSFFDFLGAFSTRAGDEGHDCDCTGFIGNITPRSGELELEDRPEDPLDRPLVEL